MKQLYIITYESLHWCGGESHCVVWAESVYQAENAAHTWMQYSMTELFEDQFEDEGIDPDEQSYVVNCIELLEGSEFEEYFKDEEQRNAFYPCVNEK